MPAWRLRLLLGLAIGIVLAVSGAAVSASGAVVVRVARVHGVANIPSNPCSNLGYEQVVGGNNEFPGNPGNTGSSDWVRMYGDEVKFRVPVTPTVRTDCYGAAAGILLKMRMVNPNGSLSNAIALVGVLFENESTLHGFIYANPEWGSAYYASTPAAFEQNWQGIASLNDDELCGLGAGNLVTLRITRSASGWEPQCYDGSGWLDVYNGGPGVVSYPDSAHGFGVDLTERFRAGSVGGLAFDATNLREKTVTGSWTSWENTDCFSNNTTGSDTYVFDSVSSNEFTIGLGTPNPNC